MNPTVKVNPQRVEVVQEESVTITVSPKVASIIHSLAGHAHLRKGVTAEPFMGDGEMVKLYHALGEALGIIGCKHKFSIPDDSTALIIEER